MKKYPVTFAFILALTVIIGGITTWRYFYYFSLFYGNVLNVSFGLAISIFSFLWIVIMISKGGKFWGIEQKARKKKIIERIRQNKRILLIIKKKPTTIFAYFCLIFGTIAIWISFILLPPVEQFQGTSFTVFRITALVAFLFGLIDGLLIYKKYMFFEQGKYFIRHTSGEGCFFPYELKGIVKVSSKKIEHVEQMSCYNNVSNEKGSFFTSLFKRFNDEAIADFGLEMQSGEILTFNNALDIIGFREKIKIIQKMHGDKARQQPKSLKEIENRCDLQDIEIETTLTKEVALDENDVTE